MPLAAPAPTPALTPFRTDRLAHRAWQTLRKPVPELIGILGVDVPDAPDVSLAGIRADAATLNWTRPRPNRPVAKFLIQVNGVNVGESASQETAITVTGLKPSHFYNVRVIAVGHNNFQAGSRVIRLHTYGKDGKPELRDGRLPSSFVLEEQQPATNTDGYNDDGTTKCLAAGVETASIPEPAPAREASSSVSVARRNTLTRKHSPSTASMDQSVKEALSRVPEESMEKLTERFEKIRKEIEEVQAQTAKDEKEHQDLLNELAQEKSEKRRELKEKEDTTEKLKREMGSTERAMRSTQQKKSQLEKRLRDKQNERQKLHDDIERWDREITQMKRKLSGFEKEKAAAQNEGDERARELREDITALQASLARDEAELKEKGRELKEAEDQRKRLPGGEESEEWRDKERQIRRDWDHKNRDLSRQLFFVNRRTKATDDYENVLRAQVAAAQQSGMGFGFTQANASGVDFDLPSQNQFKRRSRTGTSMTGVAGPSPSTTFALPERATTFASSTGFETGFTPSRAPTIPPGFSNAFPDFNNVSAPLDEEGMKALTAGAPLSPTAHSLLPAGMLDNFDDVEDGEEPHSPVARPNRLNPFGPPITYEDDPQSPISDGRSYSLMSSPHGSAQHLPFSLYTGENSERKSLRGDFGTASSPAAPAHIPAVNRFWPWNRPNKAAEDPPPLGSLKLTQSQSFPRQADDAEPFTNKRRISFSSSWNMFNRNSAGPELIEGGLPGVKGAVSRRHGLFHTATSSGIFAERNPSSPRPLSIASSELPRPSTESGYIWNRNTLPRSEHPWSSRNVSRRPSIHGSPSALKTTLADADDEILHESEIRQLPLSVGVIGSKPSASQKLRLNPNAPSFLTYFRPKDKDSTTSKSKNKDKETPKDKRPRDSMTSLSDAGDHPFYMEGSPLGSRESRDAYSVDTHSIGESRESLSLDQSYSNTPSEPLPGLGLKESESGLRKLLRKGSSSKFSLSSMRKKGPGSVANSDKNMSHERSSLDIDEHGEEHGSGAGPSLLGKSYDSVGSSPSLGARSNSKASWTGRFSMKKKAGKEKEDMERDESGPPTPALGGPMSEESRA